MDETGLEGVRDGGRGRTRSDLEAEARKAGIDLVTIQDRLRMTPGERLAANTRDWRLVQLFRLAGEQARAGSSYRS